MATARFGEDADRPRRRPPFPCVSPETVFLVWLLGLPEGADPAEAALAEIDRLDRAALPGDGPRRLRALMAELARTGAARAGDAM